MGRGGAGAHGGGDAAALVVHEAIAEWILGSTVPEARVPRRRPRAAAPLGTFDNDLWMYGSVRHRGQWQRLLPALPRARPRRGAPWREARRRRASGAEKPAEPAPPLQCPQLRRCPDARGRPSRGRYAGGSQSSPPGVSERRRAAGDHPPRGARAGRCVREHPEAHRFAGRLSFSRGIAADVIGRARSPGSCSSRSWKLPFSHGIAPSTRAGSGEGARRAERSGQTLRLVVGDDGVGMRAGSVDGIGLSNTRARLRQLYGAEARSLEIRGAPRGRRRR